LYGAVVVGYAAVAVAFSWPLPLHFTTHLTGATTGDTGVYVWNQWVFQREVFEARRLPYLTDAIFSLSGSDANLSLHNYTPFQDLVALPFIRTLGVVATFNMVLLAMSVLTAFAMFLLARHVTGRVAESWLAGVAFAWSPVLVTRSMGHFSLVAAAPLAVFVLLLLKAAARTRPGWRDAVALGATIWWATSADVYYGVYCLMLGATFMTGRVVQVVKARTEAVRAVRVTLDVLIVALAALVVAIASTGGWAIVVFDRPVGMRTLYTPMLLLTAFVSARVAWHYRVTLGAVTAAEVWRGVRMVATAGVAAAILLSPLLLAMARRIAQGRFDSSPLYWRSSPSGVDLLAFFLPNPNHPLAPEAWRMWLARPTPDAYLENVASIPLAAIGIAIVAWALGWRPSRWWIGVTCAFGLLALGPFVHVAGVNTFVPGPWALLRYVPIAGLARTPGRFSVVMMLGATVVMVSALVWLGARFPRQRRWLVTATAVLLFSELLPAPRAIYSAEVPVIFRQVASAPPTTRVLHLPFGVRDGTTSEGDFSAQTQYFQTAHGRRLIGGYLSRVSRRRRAEIRREDVLDALMILSEGRSLSSDRERRLTMEGPAFARRSNIGFVVIDKSRVSATLDAVARRAFRLELVESDGAFDLYRPGAPDEP
jgi:hypothetical protein